ncbi:RadC family protein [Deferrisoma palaeochoriense]
MGSGIRDWPEEDRPREKLLARGADALTDPELLAILLRTGTGGASALDLARAVWAAFGGSWDGLAQAAGAEIARHPGVGPAKAAAVMAALEIGRRMGSRRLAAREPFRASRQVFEHFSGRLREVKKERFYCLLLDARNRLLREERVSEGTLTQSLVHPREAFRAAVREAASAVIFAHNHPSGDPTPSADDRDLTRRLWEAGRLLGIRVLDHVVLGDGRYYSFADEGEFPPA